MRSSYAASCGEQRVSASAARRPAPPCVKAASRATLVLRLKSRNACSTRSRANVRRGLEVQVSLKSRLAAASWSGERRVSCSASASGRGRGVGVEATDQTELVRLLAAEHLGGHRQPLGGLDADQLGEAAHAGHVRDDPPLALEHRPRRVRGARCGSRRPARSAARRRGSGPCTAAMTGTGSRRQAQQASWNVLVPRHGRGTNAAATRRGSAITVAKSRPAQKASPSPSITTARTDLSARRVRAVATSCSRVSSVSAFIFSGRLSRTRAMPRSMVQVTRASASVTDMRQGYGDA